MLFATVICCLQAGTAAAQPGAGAVSWSDKMQGLDNLGNAVPLSRSNPDNALGIATAPPVISGQNHYFSLGFGGTITLQFACRIVNGGGPGPDLLVHETTDDNGYYPLELALVEAWDPAANMGAGGWVEAGTASNTNSFDLISEIRLPDGLAYTNKIRLTDVSRPSDFTDLGILGDGFDVNAVVVVNGECVGPTPTPTATATPTATPTPSTTPDGGQFVIGNLAHHALGDVVYYWGAQWSQNNPRSFGVVPGTQSFKGFENGNEMPTCGGTWTSRPGNSTPPPPTVPAFMDVIVSSWVTKQGPVLSGDIVKIIRVQTAPGYGPAPGHVGRGTVVAVICDMTTQ